MAHRQICHLNAIFGSLADDLRTLYMEKTHLIGLFLTGLTLIVLVLEIAFGRHKGVHRPRDFFLMGSSFLIGRILLAPVTALFTSGVWAFTLGDAYQDSLSDLPLWAALALVLLGGELVFYWVHRWAHQPRRFPILWKIHRTHHSAPYMNVLTTFRLNLAWYFIIPAGWANGLALYLGMTEAVFFYIGMLTIWNTVTHADFRWDDRIRASTTWGPAFRAFEHVFVSPGIHHTHHGYGRDGKSYRNLCTILSFWDWVFGTLHIPEGRPAHYGVPGHNAHWLEELAYPLVRMSDTGQGSAAEKVGAR